MGGLLRDISTQFSNLTSSYKKIGQFLLEHPNDVAFLNLNDTARLAGVSTASVVRFARRLGYDGFKSFQQELQRDLQNQVKQTKQFRQAYNDIPNDELLMYTMQNDMNNISRTRQELSAEALQKAVRLIAGAPHVYIVGMRESYALAHYMFTRLVLLRKHVSILPIGDELLEPILTLEPDDVCIYYLFNEYTRRSVEILRQIYERKTKVVLITNPPYDEIGGGAQVVLPCYVQGGTLKNSSAAPISLTNYLSNAVAASDYEKSMLFLSETAELQVRNNILY